jgi:uncharacterized protein YbjT (DUF2867 family)
MSRQVALLAGGTGLVGGYLLTMLDEDSYFDEVRALVRRPSNLRGRKLSEHVVNFAELHEDDLSGVTHVFCALGTTMKKAGGESAFRRVDYEYPLNLARGAASYGASRFLLVSSVGASANAGAFYLRVKGELEAALRALPFEALYLFRPSILLGSRQEERPGERLGMAAARALEWAMVGSFRKYRPMPAAVLARAMTVSAERGEPGSHILHYDEIRKLGS